MANNDLVVWASKAPSDLSAMLADLGPEGGWAGIAAQTLVRRIQALAPRRSGRLKASFHAEENRVVSTAPYARLVNEGGVVRPRHRKALVVPFAKGYDPGQGGGVSVPVRRGATVGYVRPRGGPFELLAVRRSQVTIARSGYIDRAAIQADIETEMGLLEYLERYTPGLTRRGS